MIFKDGGAVTIKAIEEKAEILNCQFNYPARLACVISAMETQYSPGVVIISGCLFVGPTGQTAPISPTSAIRFERAKNLTISNNIFKNGAYIYDSATVLAQRSFNISILNNVFSQKEGDMDRGLSIVFGNPSNSYEAYSQNVQIIGNVFTNEELAQP